MPPQAKRLTQRETTSRMDRIRFFICNSSIHGSVAFGRFDVGENKQFLPDICIFIVLNISLRHNLRFFDFVVDFWVLPPIASFLAKRP